MLRRFNLGRERNYSCCVSQTLTLTAHLGLAIPRCSGPKVWFVFIALTMPLTAGIEVFLIIKSNYNLSFDSAFKSISLLFNRTVPSVLDHSEGGRDFRYLARLIYESYQLMDKDKSNYWIHLRRCP